VCMFSIPSLMLCDISCFLLTSPITRKMHDTSTSSLCSLVLAKILVQRLKFIFVSMVSSTLWFVLGLSFRQYNVYIMYIILYKMCIVPTSPFLVVMSDEK